MNRTNVSKYKKISGEPRGYSTKYWIRDNNDKLVKYNNKIYQDADLMELIASEIFKQLNIDVVDVKLGINDDKNFLDMLNTEYKECCIIDSFLTKSGDVTFDLSKQWVKSISNNKQKEIRNCFFKMFQKFSNLMAISEDDIKQMQKEYIRMIYGDCIIGNEDRRIKNISIIFNEQDFTYRLAPAFDNALAFNSYSIGAEEAECYIGQQAFNAEDIIEYILTNYYSYVEDINENFNELTDNIIDFLKKYAGEIEKEKLKFIYNYIININAKTNELVTKMKSY